MTMNELIEKLRTDKGINGVYYVLKRLYAEYQKYIAEVKSADELWSAGKTEYIRVVFAEGRRDEKYNNIIGFLLGLHATDYITDRERDELQQELWILRRPEENKKTASAV